MPNPTAAYRKIIVDARVQQLKFTADTVKRVQELLLSSAQDIGDLYRDLPDGQQELRRRFLMEKHHELLKLLGNLHADYGKVLGQGLLQSAQDAVDREIALEKQFTGHFNAHLMAPTQLSKLTLSNGSTIAARFGVVAGGAVERIMQRVYGDGVKLSGRLWNLQDNTKRGIEDTLVKGLLQGTAAPKLAEDLKGFLTEPGSDNARYRALRLARTEIANAYREAHIQSTLDANRQLKPHILAIGWRLSAGHPRRDICDVWASDDSAGLGPGNYLPGDVPVDHPHGLCYTMSVLRDYPDATPVMTAPDADPVPVSELKYWAEKVGDPVAARALAKKLGAVLPPPLAGSALDNQALQTEIADSRTAARTALEAAQRSVTKEQKIEAIRATAAALNPSPAVQALISGPGLAKDSRELQARLLHEARHHESLAKTAGTAAEVKAAREEAQKARAIAKLVGILNTAGAAVASPLFSGIQGAHEYKQLETDLQKLAEDEAKAKHAKYLADARARAKKSYESRKAKKAAAAGPAPFIDLSSGAFDLSHDELKAVDLHACPPWNHAAGKRPSYGGVVFDDQGRVLLREPNNHFGGYVWTFPKGGMDPGDHPVETALREVEEETGHIAQIVGLLPGGYKGNTGTTHMFLMRSTGESGKWDSETKAIQWATREEALDLIGQTTDRNGRERDRQMLADAFDAIEQLKADPDSQKKLLAGMAQPAGAREFPPSLADVERVKRLGGSTAAELVKDKETGKLFVMKRGGGPDAAGHLEEEMLADLAYQALGVNVPKFRRYEENGKPVKLAEFHDGRMLSDLRGAAAAAAFKKLGKHFAVDALMGNWDVIGQGLDNVLVDGAGEVWRIDNGGSLRYRAQGAKKTVSGADRLAIQWDAFPIEIWNLRDGALNPQTAKVFAHLSIYDVAAQIPDLMARRDDLAAVVKHIPELEAMLTERLDNLAFMARPITDMKADRWKSEYADLFGRELLRLAKAGVTDRLPKELIQSPGDVNPKDESGKKFDHLRGTGSIVEDLANYMKETGADQAIIARWMSDQGGSSWSSSSRAIKAFFAAQRDVPLTKYFWHGSQSECEQKFKAACKAIGNGHEARGLAKLTQTWAAQHAFTFHILARTRMRYNDQASQTFRVIRTENKSILSVSGGDYRIRSKQTMPRGAHESGSMFKDCYPMGSNFGTVQDVPYIRCTATYLQERKPGYGSSGFLGDSENEITWLPEGIEFVSTGAQRVKLDGGL